MVTTHDSRRLIITLVGCLIALPLITFAADEGKTRVTLVDGRWHINGQVSCRGSAAEGLLPNVRMVNATFEDRGKTDFNADANTDRFIARIPDYVVEGVRAITLCLQGGMPGYEGALNSAYEPDGSLRPDYLRRVERVLRACDEHGVVVILGCYYQRQSALLRDDAALRAGVVNTVNWLRSTGLRNVVLEVANEYPHKGFAHPIIRSPKGMAELLQLAKKTWPDLLVSASGYGTGTIHPEVAEASDFLLPHFNGTTVEQIPARLAALKKFNKAIVCNEDDKTGWSAAAALRACADNSASYGLMLKDHNQTFPFHFDGGKDDSVYYASLRELTSSSAVLDLAMQAPFINTNPGPKYSDEQRDYAMIIGMDRTPKGRIWAAWVAGGDSDKGYFVAASSDDNGATWSKPRLVIDPPDLPNGLRRRILVGNFWTDPTGKLWLFFDQSMGYYDGRAGSWAITCDNPDSNTPKWSVPRRLWHGATLNKPIVLKNGDWLMPISLWTRDRINPRELREGFPELDGQRMAHLFVSRDQGTTWTRHGGVVIPQSDFDEHMFVELKDGRLWMLARTKYGIAETFSTDGGKTWSEPKPSSIQNPSARFFLRRLVSGFILLVKNGPLDQRTGRAQMTAYLSDDEGKTWKGGLVFEERNGVSYPDGFQSPDGMIHILYDRERAKEREILMARFTEADALAGKLVSPGSQTKILVSKARGGLPPK